MVASKPQDGVMISAPNMLFVCTHSPCTNPVVEASCTPCVCCDSFYMTLQRDAIP